MTDATEFLEMFKHTLPNQGVWYWDEKNGTKARLLVAMTKMLKAGMDDVVVREIIVDLMFTGYVEHERQVKAKTGLSVRQFMENKLEKEGAAKLLEVS